jgi:hypothetical protein
MVHVAHVLSNSLFFHGLDNCSWLNVVKGTFDVQQGGNNKFFLMRSDSGGQRWEVALKLLFSHTLYTTVRTNNSVLVFVDNAKLLYPWTTLYRTQFCVFVKRLSRHNFWGE